MSLISLCMIVKNEEKILKECLESIKDIPDEIIITDTGSKDNSVKIAEEYADKVLHFDWINDFSAARNYCESKASGEYILTWDADWILSDKGREFLLKLKNKKLNNLDLIDGQWIIEKSDSDEVIKFTHRTILFRKGSFHWTYPIHEKLVPNTKQKLTGEYFPEIEISHFKDPNDKSHRYKQSNTIASALIKSKQCPAHVLFAHGENLLFQKNYADSEAIFLDYLKEYLDEDETTSVMAIERLMQIYLETESLNRLEGLMREYQKKFIHNPRFKLVLADSVAVSNILAADEYYEDYLKFPIKKGSDGRLYDYERYEIHPMLMLANVYYVSNREQKAQKLLERVIEQTKVPTTKEMAKLILKDILHE